jgi:hypothetical protein
MSQGTTTAGGEALQIGQTPQATQATPTTRAWRWGIAASATLIALGLFAVYFRLSWTAPVNSDGAANILQVADLLHGNLLLHGWWLSDVSFYTTELPQYALIEAILGQVPVVVHVAAAMTYTLAVVFAALAAKGRATGREGALRMLIAAGIMLAPQPGGGVDMGAGTFVLDLSLGHIGTSVPLLFTWMVIDRAGRRPWVPPVTGILLAWVLTADPLVVYVGVIPVVVACAVRTYRGVIMARQPVASAWFEITLAAFALAAVPVASAALAYIHAAGGFTVYPDHPVVAAGNLLLANGAVLFESVLILFGADFLGMRMGFGVDAALLHLSGLALASWAVWQGLRRFGRHRGLDGLTEEIMVVAVLANLFAFMFSTLAIDPSYGREIAVVLPFGAALAGRVLAGRLASARMLPALAVVLLGYMVSLGWGAAQPPVPTQNQQLANWLVTRHFQYGLGDYWEASSITVASGQRVKVRPLDAATGRKLGAYPWEADAAWYDSARYRANFVVLDPASPSYQTDGTAAMARATFGRPARVYHVGPYLVLVWHKNLLAGLRCGKVYALPTGIGPSAKAPGCS